jgi:hypothetical protein
VNARSDQSNTVPRRRAPKGQTIVIFFTGSDGSRLQSSFVIDDTALNVQ